jgi:DNA-binding transcriptional LysR family regulator
VTVLPARHSPDSIRITHAARGYLGLPPENPGSVIGVKARADGQDPRVELDWLETFLAVADRGGFTAASESVHRSQSRVSAHIAALERDLGVRLIDRTHRPARLTTAGVVFARHAREVVTGIGAARSAVVALRGMDAEPITVLITPCVGATLFPAVLAELVDVHPGLRVTLTEYGGADVERRLLGNGPALAVLPRLATPLPPGLRERVLWREPLQVVVPVSHELDRAGKPVTLDALAAGPLIVCGTRTESAPADSAAEVLGLLAARGLAVQPRAAVDTPQTLLALVRAGIGIGVVNAVALAPADLSGLAVLDIDDPSLVREVAAYWYDVLTTGGIGMELHRAVVTASLPPGGSPPEE